MATTIFPCRLCPLREGCTLREGLRRKAAETGALSIAYHCTRLAESMRIGRRIEIGTPVKVYDRYGEFQMGSRAVRATITSVYPRRHEFACVIDPGSLEEDSEEKHRFRRQQKHYRIIRFLDEPDQTICNNGNVQRGDVCDNLGVCRCHDAS